MTPYRLIRFAIVFDLSACLLAWVGGSFLRFNLNLPDNFLPVMGWGIVVLLPAHMLSCRLAGLYKGFGVIASFVDLKRVLRAVALSTAFLFAFYAGYRVVHDMIPRSLMILYPTILAIFMGGWRIAFRTWHEYHLHGALASRGKSAVVVGAGREASTLIGALRGSSNWRVVALADDDSAKWGTEIHGVPVLGGIARLPEVLTATGSSNVILALPATEVDARCRAIDLSIWAGATAFAVLSDEEVMSEKKDSPLVRPIDIGDFVQRGPALFDAAAVADSVAGSVALVTGAGGTVGRELCGLLARFQPALLVLYDRNESALCFLQEWFSRHMPEIGVAVLVGDVQDRARLAEIFAIHRPQLVFHAALCSQGSLSEAGNVLQLVRNNVLGTMEVAECAEDYRAKKFLLVSSDRAGVPGNLIGASQRLAEMVCEVFARRGGATHFGIVRLASILGGSVIARFRWQIEQGGPVTLPHRHAVCNFISVQEAAIQVLQAGVVGQDDEFFFVVDGTPVKLYDLVRRIIRFSGRPESLIQIEFTGWPSGETLGGEPPADEERASSTAPPRLRTVQTAPLPVDILKRLRHWLAEPCQDDEDVRAELVTWIPEYHPGA